jgi:hypothetical protein
MWTSGEMYISKAITFFSDPILEFLLLIIYIHIYKICDHKSDIENNFTFSFFFFYLSAIDKMSLTFFLSYGSSMFDLEKSN